MVTWSGISGFRTSYSIRRESCSRDPSAGRSCFLKRRPSFLVCTPASTPSIFRRPVTHGFAPIRAVTTRSARRNVACRLWSRVVGTHPALAANITEARHDAPPKASADHIRGTASTASAGDIHNRQPAQPSLARDSAAVVVDVHGSHEAGWFCLRQSGGCPLRHGMRLWTLRRASGASMMPAIPTRPRYKFLKPSKPKIIRDKAHSHLEDMGGGFYCTYGSCGQHTRWFCHACAMGRCNLHRGLRDAVCPATIEELGPRED